MRKTISTFCLILFCLSLFAGCSDHGRTNDKTDVPMAAPLLYVTLKCPDSTNYVLAQQLATSWGGVNEDRSGFGDEADSNTTLEALKGNSEDITLLLDNASGTVELKFSDDYLPEAVTVQRWDVVNGMDTQNNADGTYIGESVQMDGPEFVVTDDNHSYIYEVHAIWPVGDSYYVFRIDSSTEVFYEYDVPEVPALEFVDYGDSEWELKRLRLYRHRFEVLDGCGRVSRQDGGFVLSDATDAYYRPAYLEKDDEYLEQVLWTRLSVVIGLGTVDPILGFLEYYGSYYLASGSETGVVLVPLGLYSVRDTLSFEEFCKKAWEFFCFVENAPSTIYGGDGINVQNQSRP